MTPGFWSFLFRCGCLWADTGRPCYRYDGSREWHCGRHSEIFLQKR